MSDSVSKLLIEKCGVMVFSRCNIRSCNNCDLAFWHQIRHQYVYCKPQRTTPKVSTELLPAYGFNTSSR